jgi:hypothetical protein
MAIGGVFYIFGTLVGVGSWCEKVSQAVPSAASKSTTLVSS